MPAPHDFAVRNNAARLARLLIAHECDLALRPHAHTTPSCPPHPAPRFVTIGRNAPLHRGACELKLSASNRRSTMKGCDPPSFGIAKAHLPIAARAAQTRDSYCHLSGFMRIMHANTCRAPCEHTATVSAVTGARKIRWGIDVDDQRGNAGRPV